MNHMKRFFSKAIAALITMILIMSLAHPALLQMGLIRDIYAYATYPDYIDDLDEASTAPELADESDADSDLIYDSSEIDTLPDLAYEPDDIVSNPDIPSESLNNSGVEVSHSNNTFELELGYQHIPHVAIEIVNNRPEQVLNLRAYFLSDASAQPVWPGGGNVVESDYFRVSRGFSVGPDSTPYSPHYLIASNGGIVNIRVSPQADLSEGIYHDTLVITSDSGFQAEITITAMVLNHPGIAVSTTSLSFGQIEEGFSYGVTVNMVNSAGPLQVNLRNNSIRTPIYTPAFTFDSGGDSPFVIQRGLYAGTSTTFVSGEPIEAIPSTNAFSANIRVAVREGTPSGVYTDTLRIQGAGQEASVALSVTIVASTGFNVTIAPESFMFPERPQGYPAFTTSVILATTNNPDSNASRQFNIQNHSAIHITGITDDRITFDKGEDSPFEIASFLRLGTGTGTNAVTNALIDEIFPHGLANVRVRPVIGLTPGNHTDILRIRGDNGFEKMIEIGFTVIERVEGFNVGSRLAGIPDSDNVHITGLRFPDRRVGYPAFTSSFSTAGVSDTYSHRGVILTNFSQTSAVEGIWAVMESGEHFELTRDVRGSASIAATGVITDRMNPNNAAGTLSAASVNILLRPRAGLVTGQYNDVLQVRGLNGFSMDIPVSFTVYGDYGIVINPFSFEFPARQVGYNFVASTGGWHEFLVINNSVENHTGLTVEFGEGLNNLFRVQRTFTRNNSTNNHGSTAAWSTINSRNNSNSTNPHILGIRIWPQNGLPIGVHTDTMTIRSDQGLEITAQLIFEVLPPPQTWPEYITVQPGAEWTFTPRLVGYRLPDNNTGWVEFIFRNNLTGSANHRTGITARLAGGDASPFSINRALSTSAGAPASHINAASTANIRIWPREGLAPGLHEDRLILERNGEFYLEVPLAFRVYAPDVTVRAFGRDSVALSNSTRFDWHPRRYGITRGSTMYPDSAENRTNGLRPVEFLFTNNTGATIVVPENDISTGSFDGFFNGEAFIIHRNMSYHSMVNSDVSSARATTIVPGATVGLRIIPRHHQLTNLPVGEHRDVFILRDVNGIELATIDLAIDIDDWSGLYVTSPEAPGLRWVGQVAGSNLTPGSPVLEIPALHMGYDAATLPATVVNMNLDLAGGMDQSSGSVAIYFYGGPDGLGWEGFQTGDSEFFTLVSTSVSGISLTQAAAGPRQVAAIRPREGLPPGIYTDTLVLRSRVIDYFAGNMDTQRFIIYVPISFEVLPLDLTVYPPPDEWLTDIDGYERLFYEFPSMRRGYSINPEEHAIGLTITNHGTSSMSGITAEIISGGEFFSREISGNILPANGGQLNLRFWPHNMLGPGTYNGVIRLGDNASLTMYIHMTFVVDVHDVSFPDPIVFSPVFVGYEPDEYGRAYIESFEGDANIYFVGVGSNALRFELGDASPFRVVGPVDQGLQLPNGQHTGTIGPEDIVSVTIEPREGFTSTAGVLIDELLIIGHDFIRRVPASLAVHEVKAEITAPGIGVTTPKETIEIPVMRYGFNNATPVEIHIRNTSSIPFTGLSGGVFAGEGFQIISSLQPRVIQPGQHGTITVAVQTGLPAGSYTDTLSFIGDSGFELDFEVSIGIFEVMVSVQDYHGVRLVDPSWITDHRYGPNSPQPRDILTRIEGYTSVNTVPFDVSLNGHSILNGFRAEVEGGNFVIANNDKIPADLTEDEDISIMVLPELGLGVGIHTAELVILSKYGELERVNLTFEVLARDWAHTIEGNGEFGTQTIGYDVMPYNRVVIRNTGTGDVHDLTAYFKNVDGEYIPARYDDNRTAFEMGMYVRNRLDYSQTILGTVWGGMCACSTADMDVRPKMGLPVGTYNEQLIIKGINTEFNQHVEFVIPLTFTVVEAPINTPLPNNTPPPVTPPPDNTPPPVTPSPDNTPPPATPPPYNTPPPVTAPPYSTPPPYNTSPPVTQPPDNTSQPTTPSPPDIAPPLEVEIETDKPYESYKACRFGPFVSGYPDGTFRPDALITRAEFVQMLYNAYLQKPQGLEIRQSTFADISLDRWYGNAINLFVSTGHIKGFTDNTFRPNEPITRAEITALLIRKSGLRLEESSENFSDVASSHWAIGYIHTSQLNGFILGYPDGTFRPDAHTTRSEAVVLINRVLNPCHNTTPVSYSDLSRIHWAYTDIIRASILPLKSKIIQ